MGDYPRYVQIRQDEPIAAGVPCPIGNTTVVPWRPEPTYGADIGFVVRVKNVGANPITQITLRGADDGAGLNAYKNVDGNVLAPGDVRYISPAGPNPPYWDLIITDAAPTAVDVLLIRQLLVQN